MLKKVVKSSEIDEVTAKSKISANKEWTDFSAGEDTKRNSKFLDNKLSTDFGAWDKHTTAFGSKMLKRMGYDGGLRKSGNGIISQKGPHLLPEALSQWESKRKNLSGTKPK